MNMEAITLFAIFESPNDPLASGVVPSVVDRYNALSDEHKAGWKAVARSTENMRSDEIEGLWEKINERDVKLLEARGRLAKLNEIREIFKAEVFTALQQILLGANDIELTFNGESLTIAIGRQ